MNSVPNNLEETLFDNLSEVLEPLSFCCRLLFKKLFQTIVMKLIMEGHESFLLVEGGNKAMDSIETYILSIEYTFIISVEVRLRLGKKYFGIVELFVLPTNIFPK